MTDPERLCCGSDGNPCKHLNSTLTLIQWCASLLRIWEKKTFDGPLNKLQVKNKSSFFSKTTTIRLNQIDQGLHLLTNLGSQLNLPFFTNAQNKYIALCSLVDVSQKQSEPLAKQNVSHDNNCWMASLLLQKQHVSTPFQFCLMRSDRSDHVINTLSKNKELLWKP